MPRHFVPFPTALRALLVVALLLAGVAARPLADTTTTVILVRHAEKAAEPVDDPPLTGAGVGRASALVDVLRGAGIGAIYSTSYKRTRSTAGPLAGRLGLPITTFDPTPTARHGELYAAEILAKHRGQVVLLVGHSNTVPAILRALGVADAPAIADAEYDNLFVVTIPETGAARVVRARYGPP